MAVNRIGIKNADGQIVYTDISVKAENVRGKIAEAAVADKVAHALTINGKKYDGSEEINVIGGGGGDSGIEITQAEYDALSEEDKMNGTTYYITDDQSLAANNIEYDNTSSRLNAKNIQDAIDIIAKNGGGGSADVELTLAEYQALGDIVNNDNINYFITDVNSINGESGAKSAKELIYDNTESGLSALNAQDAIDEIKDITDEINTEMNGVILNVLSSDWEAQEDGTYKNTITLDGITEETMAHVYLYDDGTISNEIKDYYDKKVTAIEAGLNSIILTATEAFNENFNIIIKGNLKVTVSQAVMGTTDISEIGDGTVTGAISKVNTEVNKNAEDIATNVANITELNNTLANQFSRAGQLKQGAVTVASSTSYTDLYSQTVTGAGVYRIQTIFNFRCKGCDVSAAMYLNNEIVGQEHFKGCDKFNPITTIDTVLNLKVGDVITLKAAQYSGSDAEIQYSYNYFY